ncbi:MAG: UPF0280 family protein [Deltaproteobacteria bacterium]|nr:UPF0280 family protein [Deltaproteobacteria bacterium]
MEYVERHYRSRVKVKELNTFHVSVKETDLWVSAERDLTRETEDIVLDQRFRLEGYIEMHPEFFTTLTPYPIDPYAPLIIRDMIACSMAAGVGPMAAVAGAVAQYVAYGLKALSEQIIIENGGDIYMNLFRDVTVSIYAGTSPLSDRIGIKIPERMMPVGICSSSGKIGHSLSMGNSDVVCVIAKSSALADAAATALGNMVKTKKDLEKLSERAGRIEGVLGLVAIMDDEMTAWGEVELVAL